MQVPWRQGWSLVVGALLSSAAGTARAQTFFNVTVPGAATPVFTNLTTVPAPVGASGGDQVVMVKLITNHPGTGASGPLFQVFRTGTSQSALVQPDQPAEPDDAIVDGTTGNTIASVIALTARDAAPCPAAPTADGWRIICLIIQFDAGETFPGTETPWQVNVQQLAGPTQYSGFRTDALQPDPATAEPIVTRSKVGCGEALSFGGVQVGLSATNAPVLPAVIRNLGTDRLAIASGAVSGDVTPPNFTREVFNAPEVQPGGTLASNFEAGQGIWVRAAPRTLGERTASLTITGAPGDVVAIPLTATGISFYGHLLVDCSGSMSWRPDASETTVEVETRLFFAKQPAREINNWVKSFTDGLGYLGLTTFPGQCGEATGSVNVKVGIDVSNSTQPPIAVQLADVAGGGIDPRFAGTPMQEGIDAALADMNARISDPARPPQAADRPNLRQSMLMLSDGAQHQGDARNSIPALQAAGVRLYTIGYGVPGSGEVDHALLEQLANDTQGEFWDANANNPFDLFNAFKNAIRVWLGLESIVDPEGTIRAGQTRQHEVCVDDRAYGLTFVVDWDRNAVGGVNLTLRSPKGETITPSTSGISYFGDRMFAQYVIRGSRVRGGAGAGLWTMNLTGGAIPANADTRYSYSAMAQTSVKAERVKGARPWAGVARLLEIQLANWVMPVVPATRPRPPVDPRPEPDPLPVVPRVTLHFDAPAASFGTWLATTPVEREWFFGAEAQATRPVSGFSLVRPLFASQQQAGEQRVPTERDGERLTIAQRKAWALTRIANRPFVDPRVRDSLVLYDDGTHGDRIANDGIHAALMPAHRFDGVVNLKVDVFARDTTRRTCLQRDLRFTDLLLARVTPALIRANVLWHRDYDVARFFDPGTPELLPKEAPPAGSKRSIVAFTPKDSLGNHWGPGRASVIRFASSDAKLVGPVIDNWDGSYLQVLEHASDVRPSITITAGDVASDAIALGGGGGLRAWWWLILLVVVVLGVLLLRGRT